MGRRKTRILADPVSTACGSGQVSSNATSDLTTTHPLPQVVLTRIRVHPRLIFVFESMIIAIDGPSGSGKSTLGRMLARELGLLYIDTGSMYRAVALAVMESNVNASDDLAVSSLATRIDIDRRAIRTLCKSPSAART